MADDPSRLKLANRADHAAAKIGRFCALLLLVSPLVECASTGSNLPMLDASQTVVADYRLGPGDKINITVLGAQDISGDYTVSDNGTIGSPLVGEVTAAGLSSAQLAQAIVQKLAPAVMKDPKVSIAVLAYRPFYIFGEVTKPGSYPYASGMRVLSAVATAGGFTYRAEENYVVVTRHGEDRKALPSMPVLPDDIIRIPERYF